MIKIHPFLHAILFILISCFSVKGSLLDESELGGPISGAAIGLGLICIFFGIACLFYGFKFLRFILYIVGFFVGGKDF